MAERRPARRGLKRTRNGRTSDAGPAAESSPTAVALEALRTGVNPPIARTRKPEIPGESNMLIGDPDDNTLQNEYVGDETPGGSTPTPDQNDVDDIGRAYGLTEEDSGGALRSAWEVLHRRDLHRSELVAPRRPRP
jgi:hypothetical protein